MKKIMMINGSASPLKCGVGYYGETLVPELAKTNSVEVLTSKDLGSKLAGSAKVHHTDSWRIWQLRRLASVIKKSNPDIVHIQYPAKGYKRELGINLLPLWLRVFSRKLPVVVTLHEYHESAGLGKTRNLITILFARQIIVSNNLDRDSLPGFIRNKVAVVPIGSNIDVYPKNPKAYELFMKNAGLSPNKPTIAYFGFINPNKGLETLIRASVGIDAQILILAALEDNKPYHKDMSELIEDAKNKGAKLYVAGFIENELLSQILQECSFFVLPQPLPLTGKSSTAIVASEHGLTVVSKASNNPEYNHPYVNSENSILLTDMSAIKLVEACNDLISNPEKLNILKKNNVKLSDYFAWSSIASKHSELYESI